MATLQKFLPNLNIQKITVPWVDKIVYAKDPDYFSASIILFWIFEKVSKYFRAR